MKVKLILNGEKYFFDEKVQGDISLKLFDLFSDSAKKIVLNDNGGEKYKSKLKKFDISPDKETGNDWHFEINRESRELLREVLKYYFDFEWGHFIWALFGDGIQLRYTEVGDTLSYDEPVNFEKIDENITGVFKIEAESENVEKVLGAFA